MTQESVLDERWTDPSARLSFVAAVALTLTLLATLLPAPVGAQAGPERWVGDWEGSLNAGGQELPIIFHVTQGDAGLNATMDSPAQGAFAIPMDGVTISGDSIALTLNAAQARYDGVMGADGTIQGTWSQGGASLELNMIRSEGGEEADANRVPDPSERPQTPQPPFPYDAEDVSFPGGGDFELAGTFTTPRGSGPFPGVILVSGSGPQDRDETLLGHKPFAVLADHLTREGIAVLRYDDRGVARSGGDFATATSSDLADDAQAALAYLASRPEVDGARVGIVGHSEGGLIGPLVASRSDAPAFLVLLAGPGMTGADVIIDQSRVIARAQGADEALIERGLSVNRELFGIVAEEDDVEVLRERLTEVLDGYVAGMTPEERAMGGLAEGGEGAYVAAQVAQLTAPWFRYFLTYDPTPALEATKVPVLAVNGELDLQVTYEANLEAIEAALERAGNDDVTIRAFPGLNHLFQPAVNGSPSEYAGIDETMSPEVMELVAEWINARFGARSHRPRSEWVD